MWQHLDTSSDCLFRKFFLSAFKMNIYFFGPLIERTKKKILKAFQQHNMQVTMEYNLVRIDFIDVSFDLQSKSYTPFCKPGETLLYINVRSNQQKNTQNDIKPNIKYQTKVAQNNLIKQFKFTTQL